MTWQNKIHDSFEKNTSEILKDFSSQFQISFYLEAEASEFVRFSKSKVRQATSVDQSKVTLTLQSAKKISRICFPMSGQSDEDRRRFQVYFGKAKQELDQLPENPFPVSFPTTGTTHKKFEAQIPTAEFIIDKIKSDNQQDDFVGYLASGPMIRAIKNSTGTNHWYSTDIYFIDYSMFEGKNAVTATVAGSHWNEQEWQLSLKDSRTFLHQMRKPKKTLPKGDYKTYLAPSALAELISTASWGGFSHAAYKQGQSGLRLLFDGAQKFSKKLTAVDNYELGLHQPFNSLGEVVPTKLELIKQGQGQNLIVSAKSANEYKVESTGGDESESPKSLEILPGLLKREDLFKELGTGLYLSNLHYVNWSDPKTARMTGMTRYACFWIENGDIVAPLQDMRFDVSLYDIFGTGLVDLTDFQETLVNNLTYESRGLGGKKLPGALINGFKLTL